MSSSLLPPASASWLALLAAMTLGQGEMDQVRAHISGGELSGAGAHRLVLHSYARKSVGSDGRPSPAARPIGSLQRAITADELRDGLSVSLIQVGQKVDDAVLVAWVEPGEPILELDARTARPAPGASVGIAQSAEPGRVSIVLDRRA
jgi:hypothetical protein